MPPGLIFRAAVLFPLASGAAFARTLTLSAEHLHDAHTDARTLRLVVEERTGAASLRLSAERLDIPELALAGRLEWTCVLERGANGARRCTGPVVLKTDAGDAQNAELAIDVTDRNLKLALTRQETRVALTIPLAGDAPWGASLQQVPADWLKAPLARAWPAGELRDGMFDADAKVFTDGHIDAQYGATALVFNTLDGTLSGSALGVTGHLAATREEPGRRLVADATFTAGALQVGAMHVQLPETPVEADLDATAREDGRWDIAKFAWRDAGVLAFEATGELDPSALAPLRALTVRIDRLQFPLTTQRYAKDLLAARGLGRFALKGDLAGEFVLDPHGPQRIALTTTALDVSDSTGQVALKGIRGGIDWAATGERPPSRLAWNSGRLAGVALSAASARWQSRDGVLHLLGSLQTKLFGGKLTLSETQLRPPSAQGESLRSSFALEGVGYDSKDGTLAASGIVASGELHVSTNVNQPRVQVDMTFHGGEFLATPVYVKLPHAPVKATLDATLVDARWRVDKFDWNDPGVLDLAATGELSPGAARPLQALRLELHEADLRSALDRYAHSWLSSRGYSNLEGTGTVAGTLEFDHAGLQHFAFVARAVDLHDGAGRFALAGIDGGIDWDARADTPATRLGWKSLELWQVPFDAADARLESRNGRVVLAQPLDVGVLGGKVRIEKLSLQPDSPRGERYAGSFAIAGIEMARLSAVLGWPRFGGNLSGGIPEIEFVGDKIELHGGLDMYVFDGHLGVSGMSLQHPFGDAPALGADIHFENLDLDQVTSAFSFGGMSGRLAGTIGQLSMIDWSPVAFDAWLHTDRGGRMSYKAINDVTAIAGGGGLSDNLQTMALKLVNTFGYGRLGLRCRLREEVCTMGGIDPLPAETPTGPDVDDYTIVQGSGLPRITIIGHRRHVDWPTLVRRLEAAMQGQAPVIQ
jgi:hypothetical protein